jgi:hypothetical protein
MDAEHCDANAAVRLTGAAGDAVATGQVRVDGKDIPPRHPGTSRCIEDFHRELVPHHAWILEKGMLALEDVIVGPTDSDAPRRHKYVAIPAGGRRPGLQPELSGADADKCLDTVDDAGRKARHVEMPRQVPEPSLSSAPTRATRIDPCSPA